MKSIKQFIVKNTQHRIFQLRMRHKALSESQMYLGGLSNQTLAYNIKELRKAILELRIAILRALIGESK